MKFKELRARLGKKCKVSMVAGVLVVSLGIAGCMTYHVQASRTDNDEKVENTQGTENRDITEETNDNIEKTQSEEPEKNNGIGKEETVYVIADNVGQASKIIVSEHLINLGDTDKLTDATTLEDIENVKGDESYKEAGENIVWEANGNDIFYRGTSKEELPVDIAVKYYLDGEEIEPKELAGKSGKVKIRYEYTNNESVKADIKGTQTEVKVPFLAVSGLILDDSFKNIEVVNGRTITDGDKTVVVGYALPGMQESLLAGTNATDIEIPEYVEITADVENFSIGMSMSMVANATDFISNEDGRLDFSVNELVEELTSATSKLEDGSKELAAGLDTLNSSMAEFQTGMNTLAGGIKKLGDSTDTLVGGVENITSSVNALNNGILQLDSELNREMTQEEKDKYTSLAMGTVENSFKEGSDVYNNIYNTAKEKFASSITAGSDEIYKGLRYNADGTDSALYLTLYEAGYESALQENFEKELPGICSAYGISDVSSLTVAKYQELKAGYEAKAKALIQTEVKKQVEAKLNELAGGVSGAVAQNGADAIAKSVVDACEQSAKQSAANALIMGIDTTKKTIANSIEEKKDNGYSLVTGMNALNDGVNALSEKMPALVGGIDALVEGAKKLQTATGEIVTGVGALDAGANELAAGMELFNKNAISKLADAYNGDLKPLADKIEAIIEAGNSYQTYTKLADGMTGSVKFLYKIEGID